MTDKKEDKKVDHRTLPRHKTKLNDEVLEKMAEIKKRGSFRPKIWTDEAIDAMAELLIEFYDRPLYRIKVTEVATPRGIEQLHNEAPEQTPSVEAFCAKYKISKKTFYEFVKKNEMFRNAFAVCKPMQINHLLQHGHTGDHSSSFNKFIMQAIDHDYKPESNISGEINVTFPSDKARKL